MPSRSARINRWVLVGTGRPTAQYFARTRSRCVHTVFWLIESCAATHFFESHLSQILTTFFLLTEYRPAMIVALR